jgi:hypothetical protein
MQNLFHWKLASDKVNQPRKVVSLEQVTRDDRSWGFDYQIYLSRLSLYPIRLWGFFLENLGRGKESSLQTLLEDLFWDLFR